MLQLERMSVIGRLAAWMFASTNLITHHRGLQAQGAFQESDNLPEGFSSGTVGYFNASDPLLIGT